MVSFITRDRTMKNLRARMRHSEASGIPLLLTGMEVAVLFGVAPRTVVAWSRTGRLPTFRTLGGHRRYPWAPIKRQLELLDIEVPKP